MDSSVHEKEEMPPAQGILLPDGWLCHMTVLHGDPAERPDVIRRLEGLLGQKVIHTGSK